MDLEERELVISLYEEYSKLLTIKQQQYFELYYYEDLSLSEIAEEVNVTRNAVFDQLKKTIANLTNYEDALHLVKIKQDLKKLSEELSDDTKKKIIDIIDEVK